jgi:two-component system, OmpR family, sensor histidine kinase VicK
MSLSDDKYPESSKTEVLHGNDVIIKKTLETFSWMKASMEGSIDKDGPFLNVSHEPIWNGHIKLKKRGIKLRCVTEVTINNIQYCKKFMVVV